MTEMPPGSATITSLQAPEDAILGLNVAFKADSNPSKVNLGVGAYRTEVREAHTIFGD